MVVTAPSYRIGILGPKEALAANLRRSCHLLPIGYTEAVQHAGAEPIWLGSQGSLNWRSTLTGIHGLVLIGKLEQGAAALVAHCRKLRLPLLAVDEGLPAFNQAAGGMIYRDLAKELPQAIQHLHPPEPGLRHAIDVEPDTLLADLYGEGEVVVNSEHRGGIAKLASGFRVSARALDGVIEAIEPIDSSWFVMGVQWRPASLSASGLDVQLFRCLVQACEASQPRTQKRRRTVSSAA